MSFLEEMLPVHPSGYLRTAGDEDDLHTRRSPGRGRRGRKMRPRHERQSLWNPTGNDRRFGCRGSRLQKDRHRSQEAVRRLPFERSSSGDRSDSSDPDRYWPHHYHRGSGTFNLFPVVGCSFIDLLFHAIL